MDDINNANYIFSLLLFNQNPRIVSAPLFNYPGCSDDDKYHKKVQNWGIINWIAVLMMSLIGLSVLIGTVLEINERSKRDKIGKKKSKSLIPTMLKSFSVISNLEIIFGVPEKKVSVKNISIFLQIILILMYFPREGPGWIVLMACGP